MFLWSGRNQSGRVSYRVANYPGQFSQYIYVFFVTYNHRDVIVDHLVMVAM